MSEQDQHVAGEADRDGGARYDVAATQEKWRAVWADLNPFEAADDGVP